MALEEERRALAERTRGYLAERFGARVTEEESAAMGGGCGGAFAEV